VRSVNPYGLQMHKRHVRSEGQVIVFSASPLRACVPRAINTNEKTEFTIAIVIDIQGSA